jgi:hypothetical protein
MKRALTTAAVLALVALAGASSAGATIVTSCPSTSKLIANVTYGVGSEPVVGADQVSTWANATYTRTLLIYRVSQQSYCAMWRDLGSVTTTQGPSPSGRATVAAGIQGSFVRTTVGTTFTATLNSNVQTSGSLGASPAQIDWLSLYFTNVQEFGVVYSMGNFYSSRGCWSFKTSFYPSYGDITSPLV